MLNRAHHISHKCPSLERLILIKPSESVRKGVHALRRSLLQDERLKRQAGLKGGHYYICNGRKLASNRTSLVAGLVTGPRPPTKEGLRSWIQWYLSSVPKIRELERSRCSMARTGLTKHACQWWTNYSWCLSGTDRNERRTSKCSLLVIHSAV